MGCFSNCAQCIHDLGEYGCPCLDAYMLWNYDECNNDDLFLHKMIPVDAVESALCWLARRTANRKGRGVEGRSVA